MKREKKQREKWKIAVSSELYSVKDAEIRNIHMKTSWGFLDQSIKLLYPPELHWNNYRTSANEERNAKQKLIA